MIYFDNAATGFPKSERVARRIYDCFLRCGNSGRSGHKPSLFASECMYLCRENAADYFGFSPERVILTPSCTFALNMAIKGFIAGGKVVMSNLEHNSVCRPLYALRNAGRITIEVFDALNGDAFQNFLDASANASAVVFTHASNVCGKVLPAEKIVREAKRRKMFTCVDEAQTAGYIPICKDADVCCAAGHKGINGPMGTGLMLVNESLDVLPKTILQGGTGVFSFDEEMPEFYPERLETGTANAPAFGGLALAIEQLKTQKSIDRSVFLKLLDGMTNMDNITLYGCPQSKNDIDSYLPVILFNVNNMESDSIMTALADNNICVRSGFHCSPLAHKALGSNGGVRISLGKKNTVKEVDRFLRELYKIAKTAI